MYEKVDIVIFNSKSSIVVYADNMPEGGGAGGTSNKEENTSKGQSYSKGEENSDGSYNYETSDDKQKLQDEFNKILWTYPEKKNSEIPIDKVITVYMGLKAGGLNDYQGNFIRETSLIPDIASTVSTNVGIGA